MYTSHGGATLCTALVCRAFKSVAIRGRMIELASYFGTINLAMEDGCALAISCLGMCPITLSLMISPHFSSKMTHNPRAIGMADFSPARLAQSLHLLLLLLLLPITDYLLMYSLPCCKGDHLIILMTEVCRSC